MAKILYSITILFLILWAIGFFIYGLGLNIHLLLFGAVLTIIIKLIREK